MGKLWLMMVLIFCMGTASFARDIAVNFHGDLVDDACDVNMDSMDMQVDFGQIFFQDLYKKDKTISKAVAIHLENCDTQIAKAIDISFTGKADKTMTDTLAVDGVEGIAIQLTTTDGKMIKINNDKPEFPLQQGRTTIGFISVIKPYPLIKGKSPVTPGKFQATLIFDLSYP